MDGVFMLGSTLLIIATLYKYAKYGRILIRSNPSERILWLWIGGSCFSLALTIVCLSLFLNKMVLMDNHFIHFNYVYTVIFIIATCLILNLELNTNETQPTVTIQNAISSPIINTTNVNIFSPEVERKKQMQDEQQQNPFIQYAEL
jgi:hypothetical protein